MRSADVEAYLRGCCSSKLEGACILQDGQQLLEFCMGSLCRERSVAEQQLLRVADQLTTSCNVDGCLLLVPRDHDYLYPNVVLDVMPKMVAMTYIRCNALWSCE